VKDRFKDALNATKAAIEEGILSGGGNALLYASENLETSLKMKTYDEQVGVQIVAKAARHPCAQIMKNAGIDPAIIINHLLKKRPNNKYGYDVALDKYCNMIKAGIVDPMKVVRSAL